MPYSSKLHNRMANEEHLRVFGYGVKLWNEWRRVNLGIKPDLRNAGFLGIDLARADLSRTDLSGAKFCEARLLNVDFQGAKLINVDMREADLTGSNLKNSDIQEADLSGANLSRANLSETNFTNTDLRWADLSGADLTNANIEKARLGHTKLTDIDLSSVKGMNTVRHEGPSIIGIDTIYRSKGNIPTKFLRDAGVPENFIIFMGSLVGAAFDFYSCFISYSIQDRVIAERLHADLQTAGVRCWYFPEDAQWGQPVWGEIDRSINAYDKLVVICSTDSLQSGPVNREIERALQREDRDHRHVLFPIRLDEYIFENWQHPRKADVQSKVIGDFRDWKNPDSYKQSFARLVRDLRVEDKINSAVQGS